MIKDIRLRLLAGVVVAASLLAASQDRPGSGAKNFDTARSVLTVRVYKTGLFSAFAHDHEISAPIQNGSFDQQKGAVEFTADSRKLRVLDPGVSESDRAQIQSRMLGPEVLDSDKFSEIRFRSTSLEKPNSGNWVLNGDLTLHGQTHGVKVEVQPHAGHYTGSAVLSQKDFGITPISIAGGSIKVKDQVRVEFDVIGR